MFLASTRTPIYHEHSIDQEGSSITRKVAIFDGIIFDRNNSLGNRLVPTDNSVEYNSVKTKLNPTEFRREQCPLLASKFTFLQSMKNPS